MNAQTKKPAPKQKNPPFAILTVGGGIQAIIMDKDGKVQITNAQAVRLDEVANFVNAIKTNTPAYTVITCEQEYKLAHLAKLTGFELQYEFDRFLTYQHAEKHGYKFLSNAIVHTFMDTAPVFEVRGKDGSKRYYQCGKRIPSHLFDFYCVNGNAQYSDIAKQTKQAYTPPYRGGKKQVSRSFLVGMADVVLTVGYCQLQMLLRPLSPQVYNANIHGWQADGYQISPNYAITTGYAMIGTYTIPPHLALIAEQKAMVVDAKLNQSHTEHMEKLAGIMADLIVDTLSYHQCHRQ